MFFVMGSSDAAELVPLAPATGSGRCRTESAECHKSCCSWLVSLALKRLLCDVDFSYEVYGIRRVSCCGRSIYNHQYFCISTEAGALCLLLSLADLPDSEHWEQALASLTHL